MFSNYWPRTLPLGSLHRGYKRGILNVIYINASCTSINRRKSDKFSLQFESKFWKVLNSWSPPVQFSFILVLTRIEKANMLWKILISFFLASMQPYRQIIRLWLYVLTYVICTYVLTYVVHRYYILNESTKIIPFVRLS